MADAGKAYAPMLEEVKWERVTENRISTVIAMLPVSLQSRINPIPSIRRSLSFHNVRNGMNHQKQRPLSEADASSMLRVQKMNPNSSGQLVQSWEKSRSGSPTTTITSPRAASGIHRRFAQQGYGLVSNSMEGLHIGAQVEDTNFERKVFIDGVAYLLQGLPNDLDANEVDQVRRALPPSLQVADASTARLHLKSGSDGSKSGRSFLHRTVHLLVSNLILILGVLLPYLVLLFRLLARTERRYKVSEKIVGYGLDMANSVGQQSLSMGEVMCKANNGQLGRAVIGGLVWFVEGVSKGVSDGVGDGLMMMDTNYFRL